jgi:hypothetical protein
MDIIHTCLTMVPVPCVSTVFTIFRIIWTTIERRQVCKRQLQVLASSMAELLTTLDAQYRTRRMLEANMSHALSSLDQ